MRRLSLVAPLLILSATFIPVTQAVAAESSSLRVALGASPSVSFADTQVRLSAVNEDQGEKTYSGTLLNGRPVQVIQYEKPNGREAAVPQTVVSKPPSVRSSTVENPGIIDASISQNQVEITASEFVPSLAVATSPDAIALAWQPVEGAVGYKVSSSSSRSITTSNPIFSESGLNEGTAYSYQVSPVFSTKSAITPVADKQLNIKTLDTKGSPDRFASRTYQPYSNAVMYRTFIADAQVSLNGPGVISCGVVGQSGVTFAGDNRGFQTPGSSVENQPSFRTFALVNVNWGNPDDQSLVLLKSVGTTHKYKDGQLIDQRTASSDGIKFTEAYRNGSYAQTRIVHDVGNPFCSIGSIQYNVMTRFYRSGLIEMVGYRVPVPNHEAYARFNENGYDHWNKLIQLPVQSFDCLFMPACNTDPINVQSQN